MTHNHAGYQKRLDFIHDLLREQFKADEADVAPIQYDPECPFKYNNFVYRVTLPSPLTTTLGQHGARQPGTMAVPDGATEFIMRLTNPDAEGMHSDTRVENEVAMISLAATALGGFEPRIVPSVYGWGTAAHSAQGWILQERMPGTPVDETFGSMSLEEKKGILEQMAKILHALQSFRIPDTITKYGGVTFDDTGAMVSTAMTSVGSGPWSSYEAFFHEKLERALQAADRNPYIKGWHANGVRQRLDAFLQRGITAQFASLQDKDDRSIVHADFTPSNVLYNPTTKQITALLDYDFTCILHPSYEFLRSFSGIGGQFQGWSDIESSEQTALRDAKLHGFPSPLPENTADGVAWDVAKAWEDALEKLHVKRPRTMGGIEKVADVDAVLRSTLPWRVNNSDILRMQSAEVTGKCRNDNEAQLVKLLDHLGF